MRTATTPRPPAAPDATPRRHPATVRLAAARTERLQLRLADWITTFAGSMTFVYLHAGVFALWMLVLERSPWPTLTLIVSLEAIFLSTFVLIGQNRQAAFQQAKADHDFVESELELKRNTDLTRRIHRLTVELHHRVVDDAPVGADRPDHPRRTRAGRVTGAGRPRAPRGRRARALVRRNGAHGPEPASGAGRSVR